MATIALQIAGSALGQMVGGPIGAAIGSAAGAIAGSYIDRSLMGSPRPQVGPRLSDLAGISASEGASIPRVYGRMRVGGQVIWATEFEEETEIEKTGSSGGKSAGSGARTLRYTYFANVAIGLCEGPIAFVRRVWADGEELDLASLTFRVYRGDEAQEPDPLIVAKQGTDVLPGFRGLAYIVFERLPLADYGNRLPQMAFEVVRPADHGPNLIRAINLIPGSTEFGYGQTEVREDFGYGNSRALNRSQWTHETDWAASLDQLTALCPNLERVTLINAWFGDDLRAGQCSLRPKVEKSGKVTTGATWSVAGLSRANALPVSLTDNRPSYGGTPSDDTVIGAIRDLKARGLAVALNPFILMDIPAGNSLPDPYSGAGAQPPFPWRGRITCDPAPGQPGSPAGSAGAEAQIAAFFGTASAAQFSAQGDVITYSGPEEWSYRRMVLHQAMLAKVAGGVDTFFIGSEMAALTHCPGASWSFPAVAALAALVDDVRVILGPGTRITYAADWSEYGARVADGGNTLHFPLDALWAHPEIGAVAIDAYFPLADWRDGLSHLDAAFANGPADVGYLAARLGAGEGFDWFYPDQTARVAQNRTPITDGAFGAPWVYRAKDLVSWWSEPHIGRVNGVETGPTAFTPKAKPILLAEIGCPAVDKGTNQPNVFPDPKSVENALPHFSGGQRDDLLPTRLIEAYARRFDPAVAGHQAGWNPMSPLYGGRMVDPGFIAPWAFDARPYPAFPRLGALWADGSNWMHGHWLNGRLEAVPLDRLIAMLFADFGLPAPECAGVDAIVDGYLVERPMSLRAALDPLVAMFGLTAHLRGETLVISGRPLRPVATLTRDALVPLEDEREIERTRLEEAELPRLVRYAFVDSDAEFRQAVASADRAASAARREVVESAAIGLPRGKARTLAEIRLHDLWSGREGLRFALRPGGERLEPGDYITLETASGLAHARVARVTAGPWQEVEARIYAPALALDVPAFDDTPPEPEPPGVPGPPHFRLLELPIARSNAGLLSAAVAADPWNGPYAIAASEGEASLAGASLAARSARFGTTLTPLPPGPLWRWDWATELDLSLPSGALSSLDPAAVLAGNNALGLIGPDGAMEVLAYREASLIAERRYRLRGLLRGLGGSEPQAARLLAPGAECILLDASLLDLGKDADDLGTDVSFIAVPTGRAVGDASMASASATLSGVALAPLAPVHPRAMRNASGVAFSFIRRTRLGGDSLDLFEVPLNETREAYLFEILDGTALRRSLTLSTPDYLYPAATELADFGSQQSGFSLRIRQVSEGVGPGHALVATIPVR